MASTAILTIRMIADVARAQKEIEKTASTVDKFKSGVHKGAKVAMAGFGLAAGAVGLIANKWGELQQNLGGADAVFGRYADAIKTRGTEAYRTLGLSQSDYLATANKMGSLFQGSGLTQQRSLELTTQAMQRAGDVASVMGISTEEAMEAITGAAKGNFTMMDNLGVAMNAATIEAYALEKGLNFDWKTATQAQKTEVAMAMFFDRTKQYAGNFERESAETISGSFTMLRASWDNFVAGLGNPDADFGKLTAQLTGAMRDVVRNMMGLLGNIFGNLPVQAKVAVVALGSLGAAFIAASGIIKTVEFATKAWAAAQKIATVATKIWTAATKLLNLSMWSSPITWIVVGIIALIAVIVLIATKTNWFQRAWSAAWGAIKRAAAAVWNWIKGNWPLLLGILTGPIGLAIGLIIKNWDKIKAATKAAFNAVKNAVLAVMNWFRGPFARFFTTTIPNFFRTGWTAARNRTVQIVNAVLAFVRGIPARVRAGLSALAARIRDPFVNGFNAARTRATAIVGAIVGFVRNIPSRIASSLGALTGRVRGKFVDAFNAAKNAVTGKIGEIARAVAGIPGKITASLGRIGDAGRRVGRAVVDGLTGAWKGAGSLATNIASGLKASINRVLRLPIKIPRINTRIPGVGTVGGQTLLPALARGGIVRVPTLALVGEAGPEAVVPLDRAGGLGGDVIVYIELDGQRLGPFVDRRVDRAMDGQARRIRLRAAV